MAGFGGASGASSNPFSGGGGGFDYLGLLMQAMPLLGGGQQQQIAPPPPTGLLGPIPEVGQAAEDFQQLVRDPNAGTLDEAITLPASEKVPEKPTLSERASGFFGNIDDTFQSPSKVIGLGLLNRQDPNLALAALVASGLLGGKSGQ